jgi:hypothetical protein
LYGSEQCFSRQFRLHPVTHRVADDLAREHALDPGQIKPALASGEWSERPAVVELFAGLSSPVESRTGAPVVGGSLCSLLLALSPASATISPPCHVSGPRRVKRSGRISLTTLSCRVRVKVYVTYHAGSTFSGRRS